MDITYPDILLSEMYLTDDSPLVQIYPYLFAVCC